MSVRERIKSLCQALGVSQSQLAKAVNRDPAVISHAMRDNKFPRGLVSDICLQFPQVNSQYLMTGKGNVLRSNDAVETAVRERMIGLVIESLNQMHPEVRSLLVEAFKRIKE